MKKMKQGTGPESGREGVFAESQGKFSQKATFDKDLGDKKEEFKHRFWEELSK